MPTIGVITGYAAQKYHIRELLGFEGAHGVQIDTVDSFQGQEKDIIILSLVRTKRLGFNKNKNRVNVAISRARKSLIIVGNYDCFHKEQPWKSILNYVKDYSRLAGLGLTDEQSLEQLVFGKIDYAAELRELKKMAKARIFKFDERAANPEIFFNVRLCLWLTARKADGCGLTCRGIKNTRRELAQIVKSNMEIYVHTFLAMLCKSVAISYWDAVLRDIATLYAVDRMKCEYVDAMDVINEWILVREVDQMTL